MDELLLRYLRKQTTEDENTSVDVWLAGSKANERELANLRRLADVGRMADRRLVPGDHHGPRM